MQADIAAEGCETLYRNAVREDNGKDLADSDGRKGYGSNLNLTRTGPVVKAGTTLRR
jgi:hypothetical protein